MKNIQTKTDSCPCASNKPYSDCCQPLHHGAAAPNAEALMRSRYSAYTFALEPYLLQTWHPDTRPADLGLDNDQQTKWLGLSVKRFEETNTDSAVVEFVARYKINGKAERLHEISQFRKIDHQWYYLDGVHPVTK